MPILYEVAQDIGGEAGFTPNQPQFSVTLGGQIYLLKK